MYPSAFIQRVDDVVWNKEDYKAHHDVFRAVSVLSLAEMRYSILPFKIHNANAWAQQKAAEHRKMALKIKEIMLCIPGEHESVEMLHAHHLDISTRYTRASAACGD